MKRERETWWAILLVVGIILVGAVSAWATTYTVHPGESIQAAIDGASPGDTIQLLDGTYTATSLESIVVKTDDLSIIGQSRDGTIIDAGTWGTSSTGWPKGIHVYANNVTIKNLSVQGFTGDGVSTGGYGIVFRDYNHDDASEGYIYYSGGVVDNVKLQNNYSPMYALVNRDLTVEDSLIQNNISDGIFIARFSDNASVTNNIVLNSGDQGIWIGYDWNAVGPSNNATITGNIVNGAREGGISFVASNGAIISGNSITNVAGEGPPAWNGWSVGAISLKDGPSNVKVYNNTIYGNTGTWNGYSGTGNGIGIDGAPSNITIYYNNIYDNSGKDVYNYSSVPILANYNWWGDLDPSDNIHGLVTFLHWLSVFWTHEVWVDTTYNATTPGWGGDHFSAIQSAINPVPAGTTVHVAAGTYNERMNVNKDADLLGAQQGVDPTSPGVRTDPSDDSIESIITEAGLPTPNPDVLIEIATSGAGSTIDGFSLNGDRTNSTADTCVIRVWADNVTISKNIIDGRTGILFKGGSGLTIDRNRFVVNKNGVVVQPCSASNVMISNNLFSLGSSPAGNETAIYMTSTSNSSVTGNTASSFVNGKGLAGSNLQHLTVSGNTFTGNKDGVSIWGSSTFITITDNDLSNLLRYGISIKGQDINIIGNTIADNGDAGINIDRHTIDTKRVVIHYNSISGNANYGVKAQNVSDTVVATLNWWGDPSGPSGEGTGTGDGVSTHVIFSPWLGIAPDGNPTLPGVQITGPMLIIVAPVGPAPVGGYLNTAIAGANSPDLPYTDTIEVKHGTYDASTPITQPVTIVSEPGSAAHTTLNGNVSINGNGVLIGLPLQGFRMNGNVTVGAGNDAGTSWIHWSDLYGNVTNNGTGTFNAQYNYWGTQLASVIDGRTTGLVDYTLFLPKNADDSYTDIQALLAAGTASGIDPAIDQLWLMTRLGQDVSTFIGYAGVAGAGAFAGAPAGGEINLGGAAGGGGAVEGTLSGTYIIGSPITGQFTITDPVTGDPVTDAAVTTSLLGPDGALVFWGCATYDETTGEYVFSIDTSGLAPGTYELIIQTDDGQSKTVSIEVQAV